MRFSEDRQVRPSMPVGLLIRRLIRFRWRQVAVLAAVPAIFMAAATAIATTEQYATGALQESASSEQGGYRFILQAGDDDASIDRLSRLPGIAFTSVRPGFAEHAGLRMNADVRRLNGGGTWGVVLEGRSPRADGEASITSPVASVLRLGIGDTLRVGVDEESTLSVRVVGITVDPAVVRDATVSVFDRKLSLRDASVWASDTDPYTIPEIKAVLDQRLLSVRSVESLTAEARTNLPSAVAAMSRLPYALLALMLAATLAVLITFRAGAEGDVQALTAAGTTPSFGWRVVGGSALAAVLLGEILGFAVAAVMMHAFRRSIGQLLGEYWTGVEAAWHPVLWAVVLSMIIARTTRGCARMAGRVRVGLLSRGDRGARGPLVIGVIVSAAGLALLVSAAVGKRSSPPSSIAELAPLAGILTAAGLPFLLTPAVLLGMPRASRRLLRALVGTFRVLVTAALLICVLTAGYAARTTRDAAAIEQDSSAVQPAGSLLILGAPDSAVADLVSTYRSLRGREVVRFEMPDERSKNYRVSGTELLRCLKTLGVDTPSDLPDTCFPQNVSSPVNQIMLDPDSRGGPRADPGLMSAGVVSLLVFEASRGVVTEGGEAKVSADPVLGGNMPGLVVPPSGGIAERLGLRPSGTQLVGFMDFDSLTPGDAGRLRLLVARLAPAAQTADATTSDEFDEARALARVVALVGAALSALLMLLGGAMVLVGFRSTLRVLIDVGASRRAMAWLAVRWVSLPVTCLLIAFPLAYVSGTTASVVEQGSADWSWILPMIVCLLVLGLLAGLFLRVPGRATNGR